MDINTKVEVACEILNSLIASEGMIDADEKNELLQDLLFKRAQVLNLDEDVIEEVITEYGPIIKNGLKENESNLKSGVQMNG